MQQISANSYPEDNKDKRPRNRSYKAYPRNYTQQTFAEPARIFRS